MLYFTNSPLSLVTHHVRVQNQQAPEVYKQIDVLTFQELLLKGSPYQPALLVLELKQVKALANLTTLMQGQFNTAYLCVESTKPWSNFIKAHAWIKEIQLYPELYKTNFDKLSNIFTSDAKEYFWEKFKYIPSKLDSELYCLYLSLDSKSVKRITLEALEARYGGKQADLFPLFTRALGTKKATDILKQLTPSALWTLLMGSAYKPPYIYYYLVGKSNNKEGASALLYHYVTFLQTAVKANLIDLKLGAILFNQWLMSIDFKKEGKELKLNPTLEQVKKLNSYLSLN